MNSFTFMDIVLLLGIAQGVFLAITLPIVHQKNTKANAVLALQLGLACILLLCKMGLYKVKGGEAVQWFIFGESLIFIFGPLGYMYLKRLLIQGQEQFRCPWWHYIPAGIYFLYLLYLNQLPMEEFARRGASGEFDFIFFIVETLALIFNIGYWMLCLGVVRNYMRNEKEQLSFTQKAIPFVKGTLIGIGGILLAWSIGFVSIYFFKYRHTYFNYNAVWIGIPILIYGIGYYALKQPEIFRVAVPQPKTGPPAKARLNEPEIEHLKEKLETLIETDKIYLNNELTLRELSIQLNTTTNDLSWLLNNVYQSNFYDYINTYRIKAFLEKVEAKEHKRHTLLFLSMEVGFNSKSTFNKAFKAILQDTPSSYIKKIEC
ncbi:helix-turn-helix domain-containing protein [Spongiimicrobium salis]|uniref:helix-turn-helix domain-containing protein n=1 Tax=Spongiimicrobium salis TaxID=1667022 RepID=UPI00374CB7E0